MAPKKKKLKYTVKEAHRKNEEKAKYQAQAARRKAFLEKYRKQILFGVPALIVLIVGIVLICKATIGPGGSIPNFFGKLQGVEENWIVADQSTTKTPRYYKMGTFTAPEGYTLDPDYHVVSDSLTQTFYYTADDENALIHSIYVAGIKNKSAEEMVKTVAAYNIFAEEPINSEELIGDFNAKWLLGKINDDANATAESALEMGHVQLNIYIDSVQDASVLVFMSSKYQTPAAELPSNEEFLAEAEKILSGLSVEAAKGNQ